MAATTGIIGKQFVSAIDMMDARDINPKVIDVTRVKSFCDVMKLMGQYRPTKVPWYYHHVNEENFAIGDTTGATITGSGTPTLNGVTLTAGSSGFFRQRDVVDVNGKNAWVLSVTPNAGQDTLVLKSVDNTNLTLVAGGLLYARGNANTEADNKISNLRFKTIPYYNHIQIMSEVDEGTDIQSMSEVEVEAPDGTKLYTRMSHFDKIDHLNLKLSVVAFAGQISLARFSDAVPTLADVYGAQTTRGIDQYVSTFGSTRQNATTNVVVYGDISAQQDALLARKAPKVFNVFGATRAFRPLNTYLKGLGSSGVQSVRMPVNGREVDLTVERYQDSGFEYRFVPLNLLDHPQLFPSTSIVGSSLYYIPDGMVSTKSGTKLPYLSMRYLETSGLPVKTGPQAQWKNMILESHEGAIAPIPTGGRMAATTRWTTWQGVDMLAAQHTLRERVLF